MKRVGQIQKTLRGMRAMPTQSVLPEDEVRLLAQQRIEGGRLPLMRPDHINAGYGSGDTCCVCDQSIDPTKIEYEVAGPDKAHRLAFHFACYVVWQRECSQRMDERAQLHGSRAGMKTREPRGNAANPGCDSSRTDVSGLRRVR